MVPSGTGKGGSIHLSETELDEGLMTVAQWAIRRGMGKLDNLKYMESEGCLSNVDPSLISEYAKKRGMNHLGTIGSGNHFVEVDWISDIYDEEAAEVSGLKRDQIVFLIHTGSRGLGHQVATDYLRIMMSAMAKYDFHYKDSDLT